MAPSVFHCLCMTKALMAGSDHMVSLPLHDESIDSRL